MAVNISKQFDACVKNADKIITEAIIYHMENFGDQMVNEVLPSQAEFRNLTGNTLESYAYGIYLNGSLHTISMYSGEPAIRLKLRKDEILRNFEDYDGYIRKYFKADVDTDRGYGSESSYRFLSSYKPSGKFSIIFTTGTEYSAYLENILNLNVLTDGFESSRTDFLNSFKKI